MNLLLLEDSDFDPAAGPGVRAVVRGERLRHVRKVLRAKVGDTLEVGRLGGGIGRGRIVELDRERLVLEPGPLDRTPPPPLPVTLVLALPRPKFVGRILQAAAAMGVKRILLVQTARVEKSYWRSSVMRPESLRRHLMLGLAQARDTVLPEIECLSGRRELIETLPGLVRDHDQVWSPTPPAPNRVGRASMGRRCWWSGRRVVFWMENSTRLRPPARGQSAWGRALFALSMRWSRCFRGSPLEGEPLLPQSGADGPLDLAQDPPAQLLHVAVAQGAVRRPEGEVVGEALRAFADRFAAEDVEEFDGAQQGLAGLEQGGFDGRGRRRLVDDQRQVFPHFGVDGHGFDLEGLRNPFEDQVQIEFGGEHRTSCRGFEVEVGGDGRVHLAELADRFGVAGEQDRG